MFTCPYFPSTLFSVNVWIRWAKETLYVFRKNHVSIKAPESRVEKEEECRRRQTQLRLFYNLPTVFFTLWLRYYLWMWSSQTVHHIFTSRAQSGDLTFCFEHFATLHPVCESRLTLILTRLKFAGAVVSFDICCIRRDVLLPMWDALSRNLQCIKVLIFPHLQRCI